MKLRKEKSSRTKGYSFLFWKRLKCYSNFNEYLNVHKYIVHMYVRVCIIGMHIFANCLAKLLLQTMVCIFILSHKWMKVPNRALCEAILCIRNPHSSARTFAAELGSLKTPASENICSAFVKPLAIQRIGHWSISKFIAEYFPLAKLEELLECHYEELWNPVRGPLLFSKWFITALSAQRELGSSVVCENLNLEQSSCIADSWTRYLPHERSQKASLPKILKGVALSFFFILCISISVEWIF